MQTEADTMAATTVVSSLFMRAFLILQFIRSLSFIAIYSVDALVTRISSKCKYRRVCFAVTFV